MNEAKIRLSAYEMELVTDAGILLTKNRILQKVMTLLGELQQRQTDLISTLMPPLPEEVLAVSPKISRGENYRGLPWVVLDYPRYFTRTDCFALRSLFWWGQFFSVTLHVSGKYKTALLPALLQHRETWAAEGYALCTGKDPWQHHFDADNYTLVNRMNAADFSRQAEAGDFLKLAVPFPVQQWEEAEEKMARYCSQLLRAAAQLPSR